MDDDEAVIALIQQEGLAYPAKVGLVLLLQLNPRPNAGMNKEIVAEAVAIAEGFEKLDVFPWDRCPNELERVLFAKPCELRGV
jgi:hypothetical protein